MDKEKQTSQTDSSEWGVNSEEGRGDADESVGSSSDALKTISELAGREFKNVEEFKEHYGGLRKLVGDQTIAEQR